MVARALDGLRVVVTRGRGAALVSLLEGEGAEVLWTPLLATAPPADLEGLRGAARRVGSYDWVVLTSVTGVEWFLGALEEVCGGVRALEDIEIACIGPVTAGALESRGLRPTLVPDSAVAESLLAALLEEAGPDRDLSGRRYLLPVAAGARDILERGLSECGAMVDRVDAYRTIGDRGGLELLLGKLREGSVDLVTFASPSAVEVLVAGAGTGVHELLAGVDLGAIGPITAAAVRAAGLDLTIEASEYTSEGLVAALVGYYSRVSG